MLAATASPRRVRGKPHPVRRRTSSSPYEPYGEMQSQGASTNPYQFTGRENDGTGLYYYRARYYSYLLKRFISEDPIGLAGGPNSYAYADGDPVDFNDPYGLFGMDDVWGAVYNGTGGWTPNQGTVDFAAGMGDTLSFTLTSHIRDWEDIGGVDKCSSWYSAGEWTGVGVSMAFGGAAGWRSAGTKGFWKEFSHWIPNRMGGPRSLWNGNFVSTMEHALSDPFRSRFMPRPWKAANPMPNMAWQQWFRIPDVYKGGALGALYGLTSMALNDECVCQQ